MRSWALKLGLPLLGMGAFCPILWTYLVSAQGVEPTCAVGDHTCTAATQTFETPSVIIGCWQLLERNRNKKHAVEALMKYAEAGFTAFDTADIYGPSEGILGDFRARYVEAHPNAAPLRFFTKYVTDDSGGNAADKTNHNSRKALGVETLDLVQFHWWSLDQQGRQKEHLKAGRELVRLQSDGKIKHLAACNFDTTNLKAMVDEGIPITANQVQYSMLDRRPEAGLLKYCKEHGIKLLVFGVVGGGLLSDSFLGLSNSEAQGKLDSVSRRMYFSSLNHWIGGNWDLFQTLLRTLRSIADRHKGATIAHIASQWALQRLHQLGAGGGLILGIRDARHLEEHTQLLKGKDQLTKQDMDEIQVVLDKGKSPSGDIWDRERGWA